MRKKILFITPHVSTGGLPKFLLDKILLLRHSFIVEVFVWNSNEGEYNIQAKMLEAHCKLIRFHKTNDDEKASYLGQHIETSNPDIIHFEELPELFMPEHAVLLNNVFGKKLGDYIVLCSTHTSRQIEIKHLPDHFIFPSEYCKNVMYPQYAAMSTVYEQPIADNEHLQPQHDGVYNVLQVGLWSPHKNQGYSIKVVSAARQMSKLDIRMHFVGNMAGNFKSYWQPYWDDIVGHNDGSKWINIHGELNQNKIKMLYSNYDALLMPSKEELNPLVPKEALGHGMPVLISDLPNLPQWYRNSEGIGFLSGDVEMDAKMLVTLLKFQDHDFARPVIDSPDLIALYDSMEPMPEMARTILQSMMKTFKQTDKINTTKEPTFAVTFHNGCKVNISGGEGTYTVKMIDSSTGRILRHTYLEANQFTKIFVTYFVPWTVEVWQDGRILFEQHLILKGKKVYITLNTDALGDTLAWIPYVNLFAQKHNCQVKVSTFFNQIFKDCYPDLEFVEPEEMQNDFYFFIKIGVFNPDDRNQHPNHPNIVPLQQVAADRLGITYKEVKPIVAVLNPKSKPVKPYVVICTEATTAAKEWQNKNGWQEVVNFLIEEGYDVRVVQKRETKLGGVIYNTGDLSLHNRISVISNAAFFIGLPSGLSWLAWACGVPVVMISGFSEPWCEFKHIRVQNYSVCNGCWNNPNNKFVKNTVWCPNHKDTDRQFECTKTITSDMVIKQLSKVLSLDHGE